MESLRNVLQEISPVAGEDWDLIEPQLEKRRIKEGEFLLEAGTACPFVAFIKSGALRAFYTNDELFETNLLLKAENDFISDFESALSDEASKLSIQAIENSEVILIKKATLLTLYEVSFFWNKIGRRLAEEVFLSCKNRLEELLLLSPEERYLKLLRNEARFFQRYSLKDIASYLGITPQSLSRIRARIAKP